MLTYPEYHYPKTMYHITPTSRVTSIMRRDRPIKQEGMVPNMPPVMSVHWPIPYYELANKSAGIESLQRPPFLSFEPYEGTYDVPEPISILVIDMGGINEYSPPFIADLPILVRDYGCEVDVERMVLRLGQQRFAGAETVGLWPYANEHGEIDLGEFVNNHDVIYESCRITKTAATYSNIPTFRIMRVNSI